MSASCTCIDDMNAALADRNTKISCGIVFARPTAYAVPAIGTEKLNPRKRDRVSVLPTFCPFCGVRYPEVRTRVCEPAAPALEQAR